MPSVALGLGLLQVASVVHESEALIPRQPWPAVEALVNRIGGLPESAGERRIPRRHAKEG